jgi:hypothetical protein
MLTLAIIAVSTVASLVGVAMLSVLFSGGRERQALEMRRKAEVDAMDVKGKLFSTQVKLEAQEVLHRQERIRSDVLEEELSDADEVTAEHLGTDDSGARRRRLLEEWKKSIRAGTESGPISTAGTPAGGVVLSEVNDASAASPIVLKPATK